MPNKQVEKSPIDTLLLKIQRHGWRDRLAAQFQEQYASKLRWQIVVRMEKMGFVQQRFNPQFLGSLSSRRLELYENTLSDLRIAILGGLVGQFIERVDQGKVHQRFVYYVGGIIQHLLVANARSLGLIPRETPAVAIRSICEAKQDATRRARIAWAKFCFEHRIRDAFLTRAPSWLFDKIYRNVHHVADYFFEIFIPAQCEHLSSYPSNILNILADMFVDGDFYLSDALDFAGTVTPYATDVEIKGQVPADTSDDQYLSAMQRSSQRGST
ncbi:MAG TPA: hypothetical protein ENH11_04305 [Candidatus Acetothermia bacterium]|nr:hypothetical protein [Candidatus Acetothermia bacterium]